MKNLPAIRAFFSCISTFKKAFWATAAVFAVADLIISSIPWLIGRFTSSLTSGNDAIVFWTTLLILASVLHDAFWRAGEYLFYRLLVRRTYEFDNHVFQTVISQPYQFFIDK